MNRKKKNNEKYLQKKMKDKTCNECETWQKKKWNFCPSCSFGFAGLQLQLVWHATPRLASPTRAYLLSCSGSWSWLAPCPILLLSFGCGADCVARAMALLAASNVLAAVSESRGQQPSQAAAVAAVVRLWLLQLQLLLQLSTNVN